MRKGKSIQRVNTRDMEGLTSAERIFVDAFVSTGDADYAFGQAGIEGVTFRQMIGRGQVHNAVVYEAEARVMAHAFVAASVLISICKDSGISAGTRVEAAKALRQPWLSRLEKATFRGVSGRTLAEHSIEELRALVSNLEAHRAEVAQPIGNATRAEVQVLGNGRANFAPISIDPDDLIG